MCVFNLHSCVCELPRHRSARPADATVPACLLTPGGKPARCPAAVLSGPQGRASRRPAEAKRESRLKTSKRNIQTSAHTHRRFNPGARTATPRCDDSHTDVVSFVMGVRYQRRRL